MDQVPNWEDERHVRPSIERGSGHWSQINLIALANRLANLVRDLTPTTVLGRVFDPYDSWEIMLILLHSYNPVNVTGGGSL